MQEIYFCLLSVAPVKYFLGDQRESLEVRKQDKLFESERDESMLWWDIYLYSGIVERSLIVYFQIHEPYTQFQSLSLSVYC